MKFDYLKQPNFQEPNKKWVSRPMLPVHLFNGAQRVNALALVDSGADSSLFNASLAELLGIELERGKHQEFIGIAEARIDVYFHPINLQVAGDARLIEMNVGFTRSNSVGALLGQSDFFEEYQVIFERYKEKFELKPAKK